MKNKNIKNLMLNEIAKVAGGEGECDCICHVTVWKVNLEKIKSDKRMNLVLDKDVCDELCKGIYGKDVSSTCTKFSDDAAKKRKSDFQSRIDNLKKIV